MKRNLPLLIIILVISVTVGIFAETGETDTIRALVLNRFGGSDWANTLSEEMSTLVQEGKVPRDAIEFVLGECGEETRSMNAEDAAFALFTFAYNYDMSIKRGEYPVSLKYEIRSMIRTGVRDSDGFKMRFRERMQNSLRMMEGMRNQHITKKMNRFFGKSTHGLAKKARP